MRWSAARLTRELLKTADYAQNRVGYTYEGAQLALRWRRCVYLNLDVRRASGTIMLTEFSTAMAQRGKGRAAQALAWFVAVCGRAGYIVVAVPQPFGPEPKLSCIALRAFYRRHGVVVLKHTI